MFLDATSLLFFTIAGLSARDVPVPNIVTIAIVKAHNNPTASHTVRKSPPASIGKTGNMPGCYIAGGMKQMDDQQTASRVIIYPRINDQLKHKRISFYRIHDKFFLYSRQFSYKVLWIIKAARGKFKSSLVFLLSAVITAIA